MLRLEQLSCSSIDLELDIIEPLDHHGNAGRFPAASQEFQKRRGDLIEVSERAPPRLVVGSGSWAVLCHPLPSTPPATHRTACRVALSEYRAIPASGALRAPLRLIIVQMFYVARPNGME